MSVEEHEKKAKDAEQRLAALEKIVFGVVPPPPTEPAPSFRTLVPYTCRLRASFFFARPPLHGAPSLSSRPHRPWRAHPTPFSLPDIGKGDAQDALRVQMLMALREVRRKALLLHRVTVGGRTTPPAASACAESVAKFCVGSSGDANSSASHCVSPHLVCVLLRQVRQFLGAAAFEQKRLQGERDSVSESCAICSARRSPVCLLQLWRPGLRLKLSRCREPERQRNTTRASEHADYTPPCQAFEKAKKLTVENDKLKYRNKHLIRTVRRVRCIDASALLYAVVIGRQATILSPRAHGKPWTRHVLLDPQRREMEAQNPPKPPQDLKRWSTTPWDKKSPLDS